MPVTLKQLRYLVALDEAGSVSGAAEAVHVTQPAMSQQIKELERQLGARLFDRLPRGVRTTRAGREAAARARAILADMAELERAVRWRDGLAGSVRLGIIPTLAPYLLPGALTRLRARDLTLDIRVREAQTADLLAELHDGRLDVAVAALPLRETGLATVPLFEDRFLLAGSDARLEAFGAVTRPEAMPEGQLLLLDDGHCLADQALAVCHLPARPKMDLGASSLATLAGLVGEGFGLTLLPETAVAVESASQAGLRLKRFAAPEPSRQIALVRRARDGDASWMLPLAELFRAAGRDLVDRAVALVPRSMTDAA